MRNLGRPGRNGEVLWRAQACFSVALSSLPGLTPHRFARERKRKLITKQMDHPSSGMPEFAQLECANRVNSTLRGQARG